MKWKSLFFLGVLCCCTFFFSGCTKQSIDIERRVLTYAIGIDKGPNKAFLVTVHYIRASGGGGASVGGGGGGSMKLEPFDISSEGEDPNEAINRIRLLTPGSLYLGSTRLIVIGTPLAKTGGLHDPLKFLMRQPSLPAHTRVVLASGRAYDLLIKRGKQVPSPALHITRLLDEGHKDQGSLMPERLFHAFSESHSSAGAVTWLGLFAWDHDAPVYVGEGAMVGGHLKTVVSPDAAPLVLSIKKAGTSRFSLKMLSPSAPKDVGVWADGLKTTGRCGVRADEVEVTITGKAWLNDEPGIQDEATLSQTVNTVLAQTMARDLVSLYDQGVDALEMGLRLRRHTPDGELPADWAERMRHLKIHVVSKVKIIQPLYGV